MIPSASIFSIWISLLILNCTYAQCPRSLEDHVIQFEITNGSGVFAKKGKFTFYPEKKKYRVIANSSEVVNSKGFYSFVRISNNVGHMIADDSSAGVSISHEMIFHSDKAGMYTHSNALGSQTGLFKILSSPQISTPPPPKPTESNKEQTFTGTGTVIKGGYIVTCEHVISGADTISFFYDGKEYDAEVLLADPIMDFAVLSMSDKCPAFSQGMAVKFDVRLRVGEAVFTLGYPDPELLGIELKNTEGEISSLTGFQNDEKTMQVSIPATGGNSGGMILTENGLVAGILVSGVAKLDNVTYGLKVHHFKEKLESLSRFEEVLKNPYEGMTKPDLIDAIRSNVVFLKVITTQN